MDAMTGAVTLLVLLCVILVAAGAFVTVKAVRVVKRGVERTGTQVRQTVEDTGLRARSAQPGPVGEVARTRLELRSSIDGTRRALEAGAADDPALEEAAALLGRLHDHARQLDGELRLLMDGEPSKRRIAERLPEARERVARIKQSADSLRFAAQERAQRSDAESLDSLHEQIEIESGALRHWERGGDQDRHGTSRSETGRGSPGHGGPVPSDGAPDNEAERGGSSYTGEREPDAPGPPEATGTPDPRTADPRALDAGGRTEGAKHFPSAPGLEDLEKGRPQSAP